MADIVNQSVDVLTYPDRRPSAGWEHQASIRKVRWLPVSHPSGKGSSDGILQSMDSDADSDHWHGCELRLRMLIRASPSSIHLPTAWKHVSPKWGCGGPSLSLDHARKITANTNLWVCFCGSTAALTITLHFSELVLFLASSVKNLSLSTFQF